MEVKVPALSLGSCALDDCAGPPDVMFSEVWRRSWPFGVRGQVCPESVSRAGRLRRAARGEPDCLRMGTAQHPCATLRDAGQGCRIACAAASKIVVGACNPSFVSLISKGVLYALMLCPRRCSVRPILPWSGVLTPEFLCCAALIVQRGVRAIYISATTTEEFRRHVCLLLPLIVQMVITPCKNGNLGAGIAVGGVCSISSASAAFLDLRKTSAACFLAMAWLAQPVWASIGLRCYSPSLWPS